MSEKETTVSQQGSGPLDVVLVYTCCGSSNCGQIANRIAVKLGEWGVAHMACLAGIGAHNEKMLGLARRARTVVAINGCTTACASGTLQHAGVKITHSYGITEEGVEKVHELTVSPRKVLTIARKIRDEVTKQGK